MLEKQEYNTKLYNLPVTVSYLWDTVDHVAVVDKVFVSMYQLYDQTWPSGQQVLSWSMLEILESEIQEYCEKGESS